MLILGSPACTGRALMLDVLGCDQALSNVIFVARLPCVLQREDTKMLLSSSVSSAARAISKSADTRRCAVITRVQTTENVSTRRCLLSIAGLSLAAAAAGRAQARDFKEALRQKEARRAKLKGTASNIKDTGKDQQVFRSSDYMVTEEARTPNVHSRQNEGAKTQENI